VEPIDRSELRPLPEDDASDPVRLVLTGRGRRRLDTGHPWIYADDLRDAAAAPGALVLVVDPAGRPRGHGLYSDRSRIAVRLVERAGRRPDAAFWGERVERAVERRRRDGHLAPGGACRLIGGDADGVPGLVVDRYADVLVAQSGCQGSDGLVERVLAAAVRALERRGLAARAVLERSDASVRRLEGLEPRVRWLVGEPVERVEVEEPARPDSAALAYAVDVLRGHKTGHYLDQVENRRRAARRAGERALDAFSYDGLFGVRAALAGAREVVCLDQSEEMGERCRENAERNGVASRVRFERANAMHALKERAEAGERWDLVVVDPPAFARNRREVEGALRGYRELNKRALAMLADGGTLVSASCSYNVDRASFLACLADAAHLAGREAFLSEHHGAGTDHPVELSLPESDYLKCAFVEAGERR